MAAVPSAVQSVQHFTSYVGVALAHAQRTRIRTTCALRIPKNFAEKTFANDSETAKNAKVFCALALYGIDYAAMVMTSCIRPSRYKFYVII